MSKANYFNEKNSFFHGLMFHHLHDKKNHKKSQGSITSNQFEKILKVIKIQNIVSPISLKNSKKKFLKTNKVCITFDDCLKSQIDIALPVLEKYKIKAFFFIYSNAIFGEINFHEIFRYFRQKYYKNFLKFYKDFYKEVLNIYPESKIHNFFKKNKIQMCEWEKNFSFYTEEDIRFRFLRDRFLSEKKYKKIMFIFFKKKNFNYKKLSKKLLMSKKDLINLQNLGHEIGLHSHSHPTFLKNLSEYQQNIEYKKNIKYLKQIGIKNIWSMSHPNGSYNNKTLKILKKLGIKFGFRQIMYDDVNISNKSNLELSRIDHAEIVKRYKL